MCVNEAYLFTFPFSHDQWAAMNYTGHQNPSISHRQIPSFVPLFQMISSPKYAQ
jgi:hypothetical protein